MHLRSPLHTHQRMQCPQCLRFFHGATAMAQHVESQSSKCRIRDSDRYREFTDQLTAGIADVQGRHKDNTVRYVVPDEAKLPHVAAKSQSKKPEIEKKTIEDKRGYWDGMESFW
jgi:hypothetical protein